MLICGIAQMIILQRRQEIHSCGLLDVGVLCCDTLFHSAMDEFFCLPLISHLKDSKEPYPEQLPWQLLDSLQPLWKSAMQSWSCSPLQTLLSIFDICDTSKMAVERLGNVYYHLCFSLNRYTQYVYSL